MTGRWTAALAVAAACIVLGACGGDDEADLSVNGNAAPGAAAAVCDGEMFEPKAKGPTRVAVFTDGGDGFEYTPYGSELPKGFEATIPEDASVIVCMTVTSSEVAERCEYTDDDTGRDFTVELANATYDVRVVGADSGRELATANMRGSAGECSLITAFSAGEDRRTSYGKPGAQLTSLLSPIVKG